MRIPLSTFVFLLSLSAFAVSPLREAMDKGVDPDDFFDTLGRSESKQFETRDQNFGSGKLTTTIGNAADAGRASLIQSDTKIVVTGRTNNGTDDDFVIVRYYADGELDTSFHTDGKAIASFGGATTNETAHAMVQQTDGKFLLAGRTDTLEADHFVMGMVRLTTNGILDTSFYTSGKVVTSVTDNTGFARAIAIQTDGKVVLCGYGWLFTQFNFAFVRYNTDGALDTSFNTKGIQVAHTAASDDNFCYAMVIQPGGEILGAGTIYNGSDWDIGMMRVLSDGSLDTTFSNDGVVQTVVTTNKDDIAYSIALDTSNRIVLGGNTKNGSNNLDFAVLRYLSNGALDTSFYTTGASAHTILTGDEGIFGIQIQTNGRILAGGYSYNGANDDFATARFRTNGALDTAFHTDGKFTAAILAAQDVGQSLSLYGDDYIVQSGRAVNGSGNFDIAIARYRTDGTLDPSGRKRKNRRTHH